MRRSARGQGSQKPGETQQGQVQSLAPSKKESRAAMPAPVQRLPPAPHLVRVQRAKVHGACQRSSVPVTAS